ncbi:hypothetical protein AB0K43_02825 [Kitasatospora sp. NPDC049258]|uniref:hypothetical protein n=1 Tax=Kitasatospora sp. NPDC049258 TaxID=3155394 RepID=UPI00343BCCAB
MPAPDWLPQQISTEISRRTELPTAPAAPPTVLDPAGAVADLRTIRVAPAAPAGEPAPRPRRGARAAVAAGAVALLAGAGGACYLLDPGADEGGDYTAVHTGTELTSPDHTYEFDLTAGSVVPQSTATWYVGRTTDEFFVPEDSDAYIAPAGSRPTLADCVKGIDSRPDTALPFTTHGPGRAFCVRARTSRDVAVVRVLSTGTDDGPVKVSVDFYRHDNG